MNSDSKLTRIQKGENYKVYDYLGCHLSRKNGKAGAYFRVFAPNAKAIFVVGDFNDWDKESHPLHRIKDSNIWEVFVEKAKNNQKYKYIVVDENDKEVVKCDPYATYGQNLTSEKDYASIIYDMSGYNWKDSKWQAKKEQNLLESPMNIYEVNFNTWKRHSDGSYYTYREFASTLVPYVKKMGYTHIEVMPISEYPYEVSMGYQITGYFAVTSRFGKPKDFMYFVDKCHEAGLGVILDWVPGHFIKDDFGLIEWDGTCLYESPKWDRKLQLAWGTRIFDYENPYVVQFLISSALFYLRKYHLDGLRVDAVSSVLYLDFARNHDEWVPSADGSNINYAGVEFFKKLNCKVFEEFPDCIMVAEEATSFPLVTRPTHIGGLGFNFKWNIGWINDIWEYTSMDPYFRKFHHNIITHSLDYCFTENYILPVDHDEVSNGRHSLIGKMNGDFDFKTKVDLCRAFFMYMYMHPGKKLVFMGCEFGQIAEWTYDRIISFVLMKSEKNKKLSKFVQTLNELYKNSPEMYERDYDATGFEWLVHDDNENCVNAFARYDKAGNYIICVCNFSPYHLPDYVMGVNEPGCYEEILSTDYKEFGGSGEVNELMYSSIMNKNGKTNAIRINLPANSAILIKKVKKPENN